MPPARRGPTEDRGVAMERILRTARASFAEHGFAGTSMRAVALEANVDPRLVAYYFGDKARLLEACLQPPTGFLEDVTRVAHGPLRSRGTAMVANMLAYWEDPQAASVMQAGILTAAHDVTARQRLTALFRDSLVAAVADGLDDDQRYLRANLVASMIIGLSMTRYVYHLEPIASMPAAEVARLVGPTVQRFLSGRLPASAATA